MKESKFLGALLPSSPDFLPIIETVREKYNLPEVSPDDDPIQEIYLEDEIVPLEEFRRDIDNRIRENLDFFPPATAKQYQAAKKLSQMQELKGFDLLPDDYKQGINAFIQLTKAISEPFLQVLDAQIDYVVNMLYVYLLTGETLEAPSDWFGNVVTLQNNDEPIILAMASEITNLEVFIEQIRQEHKKTFGMHRPKITNTAVSTAYYLRLKRAKKPWNFIVEEYIRRNKFSLPRNKSSKKHFDTWHLYEDRLKKRMRRTEAVLDVIVRDKK